MASQQLWQKFIRDKRGVIAVMFGLMIIPVLAIIGAAIDFRNASLQQARLQAAVEAAAVAVAKVKYAPATSSVGGEGGGGEVCPGGICATEGGDGKGGGECPPYCIHAGREGGDAEDPQTLMESVFYGHVPSDSDIFVSVSPDLTEMDDDAKTVIITATASVKTNLIRLLGFTSLDVTAAAKAGLEFADKNIAVNVVIDMTASMGLPGDGSPAPLNTFGQSLPAGNGCYMFCHDDGSWTRSQGLTPKMDSIIYGLVNNESGLIGSPDAGFIQMIDDAVVASPVGIAATYSLYYFDYQLYTRATDVDVSSVKVEIISPYVLSPNGFFGGTDISASLQQLIDLFRPDPDIRRIFVIISDGFQERAKNPFNPQVCTDLKTLGDVMTFYVKNPEAAFDNPNLTYLVPNTGQPSKNSWDWDRLRDGGPTDYGYSSGLNNSQLLMRNCATKEEWAFKAETGEEIIAEIKRMGQVVIAPKIRIMPIADDAGIFGPPPGDGGN